MRPRCWSRQWDERDFRAPPPRYSNHGNDDAEVYPRACECDPRRRVVGLRNVPDENEDDDDDDHDDDHDDDDDDDDDDGDNDDGGFC